MRYTNFGTINEYIESIKKVYSPLSSPLPVKLGQTSNLALRKPRGSLRTCLLVRDCCASRLVIRQVTCVNWSLSHTSLQA